MAWLSRLGYVGLGVAVAGGVAQTTLYCYDDKRQGAGGKSKTMAEEKKIAGYHEWGYLKQEEYFMALAILSAQRSKDPICQVGACIVNKDNRIVGMGYNGMPDMGIKDDNDDKFSWEKGKTTEDNKHYYVCHAELNAICNKIQADIRGCTLYCTRFPCNECAKLIIQSGIKAVVYKDNRKEPEDDKEKAAMNMFKATKDFKVRQYKAEKPYTPFKIGDFECNL